MIRARVPGPRRREMAAKSAKPSTPPKAARGRASAKTFAAVDTQPGLAESVGPGAMPSMRAPNLWGATPRSTESR
jgi:hypothetical protein